MVEEYCNYCREITEHKRTDINKLNCVVCGCTRLDKIQGFNANLM